MASAAGCLDLLTTLAALDSRLKFDGATAVSWSAVLDDVPDELLVPAGLDAARANEAGYPMNVGMVRKCADVRLRLIARDVRSAKLRGLVRADWPTNRALPAAAREALDTEFAATNTRTGALEGGPSMGQVTR